MHIIKARNVQQALPEAVRYLLLAGMPMDSRYGRVIVAPNPVATVYTHPRERVLFWPQRDANPFFHFYEGLWMLGGRNDVASLERFVKRMRSFSDDGTIFHGAYGYRWRRYFGFDQLQAIAARLKADLTDRRQVLQIWDAAADLPVQVGKKDIPCNLMATFQVHPLGALDMVVFNRSNDVIWGCYGANAVHFSMLQEFMSILIGVPVGTYTQISVNWHAYTETLNDELCSLQHFATDTYEPGIADPYEFGDVEPFPLINGDVGLWQADLQMFLDEGTRALGYRDVFFRRVAVPILRTHELWTQGGPKRFHLAWEAANQIRATDWKAVIEQWLLRRKDKM